MQYQALDFMNMDEAFNQAVVVPPGGKWHRIVPWLSGIVVLIGLIAVVLHFGELEEIIRLARAARPSWLLAALAFQVGTYFATAAVWQLGMRRAGWKIGLFRLIPLSLAKLFTDQVFPSGGLRTYP